MNAQSLLALELSVDLTPLQPDAAYCVYCHAPASGPCATCQALICADCAVITGGSVKRVAVCTRCHEAGAGVVRAAGWWSVLRAPMLVILGLGLLAALLSWLF